MVSAIFHEVIKCVTEYEEEILFDVEAPQHWYEIVYENNKLKILEIDEYHFNGEEWGEIDSKHNVNVIEEFSCEIIEYINFIIRFFKAKALYVQHEYPQKNYVLTKINIQYMEVEE